MVRRTPKRKAVGSNPARDATSEWTTLHSKSPAVWLGFSHTAPSFLLLPTKLCAANFRGGPALRARKGAGINFITQTYSRARAKPCSAIFVPQCIQ